MAITRDEVLHVARLARLELTEDEVARFTRAAERDPGGGRQGLGARPLRRRADGAPARRRQRLGRGRAAAVAARRGGAGERARPRRRLLQGAAGMTIDTLRLTAEEAMRPARARRGLRRRAPWRLPRRDRRARRRAARLPAHRRRGRGRRRADRVQGPDLDARRRDDGRLEDPRGLRPGLRRDRRDALPRRRAAAARQDQHGRVRDGLVDRELGLRADAEPVGSRARAGRILGRLGGGGRRRARAVGARLRHGRLGQAAGRALRRSSGCGRPTAPSRATGSSPSRRASTRSAR